MLPHERSLVKKYEHELFALVGVNNDESEELKKALKDNPVTWRSFRDRRRDKPAVSNQWNVSGWPTLYLIDHHGVIRRRWVGDVSAELLDREIDKLVETARADK